MKDFHETNEPGGVHVRIITRAEPGSPPLGLLTAKHLSAELHYLKLYQKLLLASMWSYREKRQEVNKWNIPLAGPQEKHSQATSGRSKVCVARRPQALHSRSELWLNYWLQPWRLRVQLQRVAVGGRRREVKCKPWWALRGASNVPTISAQSKPLFCVKELARSLLWKSQKISSWW